MTTTAHGAKRVWGGASLARNVESGYQPRVSLHKLLHPQMYPKDEQRQKPPPIEARHEMITAYLKANGPATAPAMEAAFDLRRDAIGGLLRKGIDGIVALRQERSELTGRMCSVWGLEEIHTDESDEQS